jgi:hypothetical protein
MSEDDGTYRQLLLVVLSLSIDAARGIAFDGNRSAGVPAPLGSSAVDRDGRDSVEQR